MCCSQQEMEVAPTSVVDPPETIQTQLEQTPVVEPPGPAGDAPPSTPKKRSVQDADVTLPEEEQQRKRPRVRLLDLLGSFF